VTLVSVAPGTEKAGHDTDVAPTPPLTVAGNGLQLADGVVFAYAAALNKSVAQTKLILFLFTLETSMCTLT
jgi:hypothetical protein